MLNTRIGESDRHILPALNDLRGMAIASRQGVECVCPPPGIVVPDFRTVPLVCQWKGSPIEIITEGLLIISPDCCSKLSVAVHALGGG